MDITYNLVDEPWIPVLYRDGRWERVGIRKALEEAGEIRQIAASNPMDRVAILRFLLALLYWCRGNPSDELNATLDAPFLSEWFAKIEENRECFELLGNGKRFYQDITAKRNRASTDLIQEIPAGNNFWHFRHSTDGVDGICPSCCTLGLLRLPLFSVSGLPDLKSGINGTPPIYVIPYGISLLETLRINWIPCANIGMPVWVQPDLRPIPGENVPLLTGLTMLSRRVFLHNPVEQPGACTECGTRNTPLIRTCDFQTAGKQENDQWNDPHVIYSNDAPRKSTKALDLRAAGKFKMDRPWPDLLARIIERNNSLTLHKPTPLLIVGFATNKALSIDVWERIITFPLAPILETAAPFLELWKNEGYTLIRKIRPFYEKTISRKHVEIPPIINSIRPHVEEKVSAKVSELITGADEAWTKAAMEYRPMMEMVSKSLSPGFTTRAVEWRRQITRVKPDMRPKPAQKSGQKKGKKA